MSKQFEAMKLALEALEVVTRELLAIRDEIAERGGRPKTNIFHQRLWDSSHAAYVGKAIPAGIAIGEALAEQTAQQEQEPVYPRRHAMYNCLGDTTGWSPRDFYFKGIEDCEALQQQELAEQQAAEPAQSEIDWKDQYEKQKRRADMWVAKYEADIGPLEKAGPAAEQTAQQEQGWKMVPVEPTDKMVQAAHHLDLSYMPGQEGADRAAIYRAMLSAAPTLTDDEIDLIWMQPIKVGITGTQWRRNLARAIESKLKEKSDARPEMSQRQTAQWRLPNLPEPVRRQNQQMSDDGNDKAFFDCYESNQMIQYAKDALALNTQQKRPQTAELHAAWGSHIEEANKAIAADRRTGSKT